MESKIVKNIARFFSVIFNPFLVPTIGFFILMSYVPGTVFYGSKLTYFLYLVVFISTCIIPLLFIQVIHLNRTVNQRRDRMLPYFFTAFSTFLGAQMLAKIPVPGIFRIFLLGISIILVILFFVTMKWKMSLHTTGIGVLSGIAISLAFRYGMNLYQEIIYLILIAGIVGTSRIYLEKNTPGEVYFGFSLGLISMYSILYFI